MKLALRMRVPGHAKDFEVLGIEDMASVGDLKQALHEVMGRRDGVDALPVRRMRCIFSGRNLDDDLSLREAGIKDKGVVQIFPRPA